MRSRTTTFPPNSFRPDFHTGRNNSMHNQLRAPGRRPRLEAAGSGRLRRPPPCPSCHPPVPGAHACLPAGKPHVVCHEFAETGDRFVDVQQIGDRGAVDSWERRASELFILNEWRARTSSPRYQFTAVGVGGGALVLNPKEVRGGEGRVCRGWALWEEEAVWHRINRCIHSSQPTSVG